MSRQRKHYVPAVLALALVLVLPVRKAMADAAFVRGDVDQDTVINVADALTILKYLLSQFWPWLPCQDAADVDDSGTIDTGDVVYLMESLFAGGAMPPPPFPGCGADSTEDLLGCDSHEGCTPSFLGMDVVSDGVFYAVSASSSMSGRGEVLIIKREMARNISYFPDAVQFGAVFFAASVSTFPADGFPATADRDTRDAGLQFVMDATVDGAESCIREGLVAAVRMAKRSTAAKKIIFCVSDGTGVCGQESEAAYLAATLDLVSSTNAGEATIHAIGVNVEGAVHEDFLKNLAEGNGGVYTRKEAVDR